MCQCGGTGGACEANVAGTVSAPTCLKADQTEATSGDAAATCQVGSHFIINHKDLECRMCVLILRILVPIKFNY